MVRNHPLIRYTAVLITFFFNKCTEREPLSEYFNNEEDLDINYTKSRDDLFCNPE